MDSSQWQVTGQAPNERQRQMRIRISKDNQVKQQPSGKFAGKSKPDDDGLDSVNLALASTIENMASIPNLKSSIQSRWKLWNASYWKSKTKRLF